MHRHIDLHTRTRPYRITREAAGWVLWDARRAPDRSRVWRAMWSDVGERVTWLHPTHAAAIAALDAHLREQAAKEDS